MAPLNPPTPEERKIVKRVEGRRLSLSGDQAQQRLRMEEIMRWINPVFDPVANTIAPHPEMATAERQGKPVLHADWTGQGVIRWTALIGGEPPIFRVEPPHVGTPLPSDNADQDLANKKRYEIDRLIADDKAGQMESQTAIWSEAANLERVLLWGVFSFVAFGKGVIRSTWNPEDNQPTAEVMENPSQVYCGWSKRWGKRKLSWVSVIEEIAPEEANRRFGLSIPINEVTGAVDWGTWLGHMDEGEFDIRPEQAQAQNRYVHAIEAWEYTVDPADQAVYNDALKAYNASVSTIKEGDTSPKPPVPPKPKAMYCFIVANRIIEGPRYYPFKRLPFHVLDNHILTYAHGKAISESIIPLNRAYDLTLDKEQDVIEFESGPRYKGLNMDGGTGEQVDMPRAGEMIPLPTGQDIQQLDARVDFFPAQVHGNELREAKYKASGLTPIAWGMSPNAQTSGRAMTAEWRAVELPLVWYLRNISPEIKELYQSWWDYAEMYLPEAREIANGYRRFKLIWKPMDVRDRTEVTQDLIAQLQAGLVDPETAISEVGRENTTEIITRVKEYFLDPVWNPLRYQQILTLQQLTLNIQAAQMQLEAQRQAIAQQQQQQGGGQPAPGSQQVGGMPSTDALVAQGQVAAVQEGQQQPGVPGSNSNNAPQPPGALAGAQSNILLRGPMEGGIGSQVNVPLGGGIAPAPVR